MSEITIDHRSIAARQMDDGRWVVGLVFDDKESGLAAIKALVDAWNTIARRFR